MLAKRAGEAIDKIIIPAIVRNVGNKDPDACHLANVSHGLCISELIGDLVRRTGLREFKTGYFAGMNNTAWTRVVLGTRNTLDRHLRQEDLESEDELEEVTEEAPPPESKVGLLYTRVVDIFHLTSRVIRSIPRPYR